MWGERAQREGAAQSLFRAIPVNRREPKANPISSLVRGSFGARDWLPWASGRESIFSLSSCSKASRV